MVESILRNLNVKTGFYSSPHLLNVTERIRLNGDPIPKPQFAQYFWKVFNTLEKSKVSHVGRLPLLIFFFMVFETIGSEEFQFFLSIFMFSNMPTICLPILSSLRSWRTMSFSRKMWM